jgi:DDE superfamily endonuclease
MRAARKQDSINLTEWTYRQSCTPDARLPKPVNKCNKMWAFNHELSRERITVEHVLGMLVRHFGMLWKVIEIDMNNVPTVFCVMCKLHNICIDQYMEDHPNAADEYIVNKVRSHILAFGNDRKI